MAAQCQHLADARSAFGARQWQSSAEAYARVCGSQGPSALTPEDQLRRNLAANLAELHQIRPEVAARIESAPNDPRFALHVTRSGRPTLSFTPHDGATRPLCPVDDPLESLASVMQQIKPARQAGQPLILLGTADGYLLTALARHPWPLAFGRQQCVYLVEPNPGNLLLAMMLHDWTGPTGPIRQERFRIFVGSDALAQLEAAMRADPFLPFPELNIASEPDGPRLAEQMPAILQRIVDRDRTLKAEVERVYAREDLPLLAAVTSERPPRPPRAMLLTTVSSTVLQYSTADTAEALRELGWDVHVVIEPSRSHTLTRPGVRQAMLDHRPDLLLQIDHVRSEHGDLFPPSIPFLCWTQDHLRNLTQVTAGRSQGRLDFLLTNHGPWYTREFEYPADRHIALGKLTRVPQIPAQWASDGPDLCYVSNASKRPEGAAADLLAAFAAYPELQRVIPACIRRIEAVYAAGGALTGTVAVQELVAETGRACGVELAPADLMWLATELFERVNNLHYRQQALIWTADLADRLGLTFAIYGNGWADHPRLGRYARGPVAYGRELEELTRSAKINLQIVPYFCLHQRLLDGLAAGGFYLVREHPSDRSIAELAAFLERHAASARDLPAALQQVPPQYHAELRRLADANAFIADRLDPVELVRVYTDQGLFVGGESMPPRIGEVSFSSPEVLEAHVRRFLGDAALRREIALEQRRAVVDRLSYTAGFRRVLRELHGRLAAMARAATTSHGPATPAGSATTASSATPVFPAERAA